LGLRRRFGSSGAIRAHNLSPTNAAATCSCVQRHDPSSRSGPRFLKYSLSPAYGSPKPAAEPQG
jgi:hypothetical protein